MELTAISIDDEPYILKYMERQLCHVKKLTLLKSFQGTEPALDFLAREGRVNIVFCDIEMPSGGGLDAAPALSAYCDYLVFVTGHSHYALKSYRAGVDAFLTKPVRVDEVQAKVDKLCKLLKTGGTMETDLTLYFAYDAAEKTDHAVVVDEIIEISSNGNYVDIVTAGKKITEHATLTEVEKFLEKTNRFIRVNRSVLVAKDFIESMTDNIVYLYNGTYYAIGRTFQKAFRDFKQAYRRDKGIK